MKTLFKIIDTNPSTQSQSEQNPSDSTMVQQDQTSNQVNSKQSRQLKLQQSK